MKRLLEALAARRRFGMKPGLDTISAICARLGNPQEHLGTTVHIAGTNGKGAVSAMLDACLGTMSRRVARYTSPHLVRLNERFFFGGKPFDDDTLERAADGLESVLKESPSLSADLTFFEALTAVAFKAYAEKGAEFSVIETGLGGRLDATNICRKDLAVITRIGLEHCDWLGDTKEKIAGEKAGIIRSQVPVVLGANDASVIAVVKARADELGAPFVYAPDIASECDIPEGFSLSGSFNRENAVTAIAALRTLLGEEFAGKALCGMKRVVWPGRFQVVGEVIVDGAHNPPAARALAAALDELGSGPRTLIAGFCGDKDVVETLKVLRPYISRAIAVKTNNPRSLEAEELAVLMRKAGVASVSAGTIGSALSDVRDKSESALVCGSLFLAGEALVALGAYPWSVDRFDCSELLR